MKQLVLAALLFVSLSALCLADDPSNETYVGEIVTPKTPSKALKKFGAKRKGGKGNANVRTKGSKGEIDISDDDGFSDTKTISMRLGSIEEVGKRREGKGGKPGEKPQLGPNGKDKKDFEELRSGRNAFKSFDNQNFKLGEVNENDTYPGTNYSVSSVSFSTEMKKKFNGTEISLGTAMLVVFAFKEDAQLDNDGEISTLNAGSVKINLIFQNFTFCTNVSSEIGCDGEDGEGIDVGIIVKGKKGKKMGKAKKRGKEKLDTFAAGDKSAIRFSKKVEIDGVLQDIPEGFPEYESKGPYTVIKIRINKFNSRAMYDPIVDLELDDVQLEDEEEDDENAADAVHLSTSLCLLLTFTRFISQL